ncbi:DUF1752-domain-containing protein [Melanomma pulvis-pyrius CBS 109.77]|uniref:DUF1752-domain-containing protein n=1 Tax=Melanomma pulvis-pyrius CBS 109.77 TaxID=1314802 RepID=A0A6A6XAD4_9PLEO|nr:DUF1752-domain-containing protein [Melanomma pulvis-pyrius CBS 109.77]
MPSKPAISMLGGSQDEDAASSIESSTYPKRFKNKVTMVDIQDTTSSESESESESQFSIKEDDSEDDLEDGNDNSGPSNLTKREMFHKIDSKPKIVSHESLLTALMHGKDRANALNEDSRATLAIVRSWNTPNGPPTGNPPQEDSSLMMFPQASRPKPIIMTTSNIHPPMLSPRTTRRNMLQTELPQALLQNLLWERQQKNLTTNAVNKRQQSAGSIPAIQRRPTANGFINDFPEQRVGKASTFQDATKKNNSCNSYFDQGLQEYHQKGW